MHIYKGNEQFDTINSIYIIYIQNVDHTDITR